MNYYLDDTYLYYLSSRGNRYRIHRTTFDIDLIRDIEAPEIIPSMIFLDLADIIERHESK